MNEKLKPCPFCGGKAVAKSIIKKSTGFTIWCECSECYAQAGGYCPDINDENTSIKNIENCKQLAIKAWNRRANNETD